MEQLRVLELYSGIGGMHYALKECRVPALVVAAVDVNTTANEVYRHNFPATPLWAKTIEGLTLDDFNRLDFDMILMSPPCQPFTRIGLQGDVSDPRTKSFLYILDILPRLAKRPRFLLLENVKGFETSSARDALVKTLKDCGYSYQEFLLSPTCLGIPNSRLRYFLIARVLPESFSFQTTTEVLVAFPESKRGNSADRIPNSAPSHAPPQTAARGGMRGDFLEEEEEEEEGEGGAGRGMGRYLLPPKTLLRYALLMDIVRPSCRRSVCFTKGYGHYVEGTGSVLQSCTDAQVETAFAALDSLTDEQKLLQLSQLRLRYFSPREIANLMGFPSHFSFPENTTIKQRYRVLGNSLNVHVVARLIALMVG
ncbi:hypothetical protein ANANG_G00077120 [Anguilla anguilla]|uniref:tRNA (cytosine(38)-C(5))-methyltransferase n=1 Tax=Anguilla anguilla TaxID=7936 RepID=A0A9D3MLI9_ANGAN|nr:hypothetical protein ANANG_G00077120 [Anguilla anguilla]